MVATKPGVLEKPGTWQISLEKPEKPLVWKILKKKTGIFNKITKKPVN